MAVQTILLDAWPPDAAPPPYPYLHGGKWTGTERDSPDPLRRYVWADSFPRDPREGLQCYALLPVAAHVEHGVMDGLESVSRPGSVLTLSSAATVRFDFGVESAGWLEFESDDLCGDVELSISEYNRPGVVNAGAASVVKTAAPKRKGTTWRVVLNEQLYEGVRYGWVHVRQCPRPWTLRNLRLVCQTKPVNYRGDFLSSDPVWNRIWETGAYSVKLNLLQDHFGAILMERSDRHSWTGDAYVSQAVAMAAFGNFAAVRANLVRMEDDDNGIEAYSLYWVLAALEYARRSGDVAYVLEQGGRITGKLKRAAAVIAERKLLIFCGHDDRVGACFEEPESDANHAFFASLAFRVAAAVRGFLKNHGSCPEVEAVIRELCEQSDAAALRVDWSEVGLHAGTEAVLAGRFPDARTRREFVQREYGNPVRAWSYSPFNGYLVLQGMAEVGAWAEAAHLLRRGWGGMLDLGATSFWESFRPEWSNFLKPGDPPPNGMHGYTSLCHPWSAGPTAWLTDQMLGVTVEDAAIVRIRNGETALAEFVEGTIPVAEGLVEVQREGGHVRVVIPEGITGRGPNGDMVRAGVHEFADGKPPARIVVPEIESSYPCHWLPEAGLDYPVEAGDGWITFCAHLNGGDISHNLRDIQVEVSEHRVLAVPRRESFGWNVPHVREGKIPLRGALRTKIPEVCGQNFTLDVTGNLSEVAEVGLLFLDNNNEDIRQVLDVLGLPDRCLLLPTREVKEFSDGVLLRFQPRGPFRIRVSHCYGADASISAILFKRI